MLDDFIASGKMRIIQRQGSDSGESNVNHIYGTSDGITIGTGNAVRASYTGDQEFRQDEQTGREAEVLDAVWTEG